MNNKECIGLLKKAIKSLEEQLEFNKKDLDFLTKHSEIEILNYSYGVVYKVPKSKEYFRYYCKSNSPQFIEFIKDKILYYNSNIISYSIIDNKYVLNNVETLSSIVIRNNRSLCIKNYESFDKKIKNNIDKIIKKIILDYRIIKINKRSYKYEYFNNFMQNLIFA